MKILRINKHAQNQQDFGGYFEGQVPDYAANLIGSPQVDASQVSSSFGRTNEALAMVNAYSSDALKNIAFVFNFSKGGAYGVYVPALDRAIKTNVLKKKLEGQGYKVVQEGDMMTAYPSKEDKNPEEIEEQIKREWETLNQQGGTAIGVNVAATLNAANQNATSIMNSLKNQQQEIPTGVQQILQNVLAIYHLAATIIHEASHARGGDEGQAKSDENAFRASAQNQLNDQYGKELSAAGLEQFYAPLELGSETIHAKSNNWYKIAQYQGGMANYQNFNNKPNGSDLKGRFNNGPLSNGGSRADWSLLVQKNFAAPIESRLSKDFMFPLEPDIDQENDIIEEQLRKQTKGHKGTIRLVTEELLSDFHNDEASYKTMEMLLEENRPKPLMLPIKKASRYQMIKEATLFGWYNNLEISDGNTIPGLGDRVMAWEDRDEDFSQEEDWIEAQPRYNPEYDLKGFYYRWIEPRFKPELWDSMVSNFSNTSPAKRFAQDKQNKQNKSIDSIDPELAKIINILGLIQRNVSEGVMKATRLVASSDIAQLIKRFFENNETIRTKMFNIGKEKNGNDILGIWIYKSGVSEEKIIKSEHYFENKDMSTEVKEVAETLLGGKEIRSEAIKIVLQAAEKVCQDYGINDLYIVGSYAREIMMGETPDVSELDFICKSMEKNIKIGYLLAKELKIASPKMYKQTTTLSFPYKGIKIDFQGDIDISEIYKDNDPENAIVADVINRDFTVNMLAYNVSTKKVHDFLGVAEDVKNKVLKTYLDPHVIISHNPMIILRAMKLNLQYGFEMDEDLQRAMIEDAPMLFDGRYSAGKLAFARENVKEEGTSEAEQIFDEFGISKIKEIRS